MFRSLGLAARHGARLYSTAGKEKIAMIGSGNFGSALVRILGRNALEKPEFDDTVTMYVHEEMIDGKPLTQIINETNENVKYLKGAKFTPNVVAEPSLEKAVEGATMVCFCLPHQFLKPLMPTIKASVAPGAKALSAIKGIDFDDKGIVLISDIIRTELSADCSVLMGANVANDMASDQFCETTIGYVVLLHRAACLLPRALSCPRSHLVLHFASASHRCHRMTPTASSSRRPSIAPRSRWASSRTLWAWNCVARSRISWQSARASWTVWATVATPRRRSSALASRR
jgi:glycerol-3-phosphate dehydrogenase (NAD+)